MTQPEPAQPIDSETLFRRHASFVARLLFSLGVPVADIDDVVQEVFLVAHRLGGYVPGPATPTSYLGSIALRAAAGARRRASVARQRHAEAALDHMQDPAASVVERLERSQQLQDMDRALARLPQALRLVLVLVDLEGESCAAVAASEGVALGTIHWRLH